MVVPIPIPTNSAAVAAPYSDVKGAKMKTMKTVRFDQLEVVGKMIALLREQWEAAMEASVVEDDEFDDWPSIDTTAVPDADPTLSVYRYSLARALLADNGVVIPLYCGKTEIDEDGQFTVTYWD